MNREVPLADRWAHLMLTIGYRMAIVVVDSVPRHNNKAKEAEKSNQTLRMVPDPDTNWR